MLGNDDHMGLNKCFPANSWHYRQTVINYVITEFKQTHAVYLVGSRSSHIRRWVSSVNLKNYQKNIEYFSIIL